jgi:hypothetical protein
MQREKGNQVTGKRDGEGNGRKERKGGKGNRGKGRIIPGETGEKEEGREG